MTSLLSTLKNFALISSADQMIQILLLNLPIILMTY